MIDWLKRAEPTMVVDGAVLPIAVRRLAQARRMTLRLAPDGSEVRVSIPRWGRTAEALAFAHSRSAWLAEQLAAVPKTAPPQAGGTISFRGAMLRIVHGAGGRRTPEIAGDAIHVGGPEAAIAGRLRRWLEKEAREILVADLGHYCQRAGRPVPALALANARRRWGSCAPSGTIRINWRLVMAPDFVRRSVVAHEVAHLVHFDHGPRFHSLLAKLFEGDLAEADRWLRKEGRSLYVPFG